ncbi:MAG: inorganic phosphate transporter, partial [Chitinophagaceae bacterium]|nr:inorganic phosphate transporter [Chitinophagaceae bacterium]
KTVVEEFITLPVIISGLLAAITWNLLTWWFGIPSSSSHTLIGGFTGAAIAHAGFNAINPDPVIKTVIFIVVAPMVGMIIAFIISLWFINAFRKGPLPMILAVSVIAMVIMILSSVLERDTTHLLGISPNKEFVGEGVEVKKISHNSPTFAMGIKKGDVITAINKNAIHDLRDLSVNFDSHLNGEELSITVLRKEEVKTFDAVYDTGYSSRMWLVTFYGNNFKWILMGLVLVVMSFFTMFLNSLNVARSTIWLKRLQLLSSAAFSIGHGGNDAQKVMGIITAALIAGGQISTFDQMPLWVPLACYTAIALGTLSGGWKIIKTMGTRITKVTPFEGVAAETAGAITLFLTAGLKIPVSSTHTITGSIIGVGATKRLSAVRWGVTLNLLWAWILTIPVSALMAALVYYIFKIFI